MNYLPKVSFPGLGIGETDLPQTLPFSLFGKEIYLYGVIIAFGFLLAILYGKRRCRDFGYSFDLVTDAILFAVPLSIIGARIYYVASKWKELYADNPVSALYIWQGGIAIYGAVIGATLGLVLFAKFRKQKLPPYLDLMGLGLLIGQLVGRWGNFFNREAYGAEITNNFFLRMGFTENGVTSYWHPTFLYESLWNLVGFVLLHFLSKKRKYDGQVFLMYVAWYGLGRAWIEGLRTASLYIPGTAIRTSQLLAAVSCLAAVGVMLYIHFVKKPDGSGLLVRQAARAEEAAASEKDPGAAGSENAHTEKEDAEA